MSESPAHSDLKQLLLDVYYKGKDGFSYPDSHLEQNLKTITNYYLGLLPEKVSEDIAHDETRAQMFGFNQAVSEMAERIKNGAEK